MNFDAPEIACLFRQCVREYELVAHGIDATAKAENRAYGGVVRSGKGAMVESVARNLLRAAWLAGGKDAARLQFDLHKKYDIPINADYVNAIADAEVRREILANIDEYKIRHGTDVHVYVDGDFVLSVECKAYAENAMLKRILFDAFLLRTKFPALQFALVQLESQLGGDYSRLPQKPLGGRQSHTLMSYMRDVNLSVITLLAGDRKVEEPIHKEAFYKPLTMTALRNATAILAKLLPN